MRKSGVFFLGVFAAIFLSTSAYSIPVAAPTILVEKVPTKNPDILSFTVSVVNQGDMPYEIKTDYREVANYRIGKFNWEENNPGVFFKSNYIILAGEKKVVRTFTHNLKDHPLENPESVEIEVEVKGIGTASYTFELEKPNFFESTLGKLFGNDETGKNTKSNAKEYEKDFVTNSTASPFVQRGVGSTDGMSDAFQQTQNRYLQSSSKQTGLNSLELESTSVQGTQSSAKSDAKNHEQKQQSSGEFSSTPSQNDEKATQAEVETDSGPSVSTQLSGISSAAPEFDTTPPSTPKLNGPTNIHVDAYFGDLVGTKEANSSIWINNEEKVPVNAETNWSARVDLLAEGVNSFRIRSYDAAGNKSGDLKVRFYRDTDPNINFTHQVIMLGPNTVRFQVDADERIGIQVFYQEKGGELKNTKKGSVDKAPRSFTHKNLKADTEYSYYIVVRDQAGHVATSNTGTFRTPQKVSSDGRYQYSVAGTGTEHSRWGNYSLFSPGDLDGDGIDEVAYIGSSHVDIRRDGTFRISYSGAGASFFDPSRSVEFPQAQLSTVRDIRVAFPVGDMNGDGHTEIMVGGTSSQNISTDLNRFYLLNSSAGAGRIEYVLGQDLSTLSDTFPNQRMAYRNVGLGQQHDYNGDGIVDILLRDKTLGTYYVLFSDAQTGQYDFNDVVTFNVAIPPNIMRLNSSNDFVVPYPDTNNDGLYDLAAIFDLIDGKNTIIRVMQSPDFSSFRDFNYPARLSQSFQTFTDLDGNGVTDMMGGVYTQGRGYVRTAFYFDANGNILRTQKVSAGPIYRGRVADQNGDGVDELLFSLRDSVPTPTGPLNAFAVYYSYNGDFNLAGSQNMKFSFQSLKNSIELRFDNTLSSLILQRNINGETKSDVVVIGNHPTEKTQSVAVVAQQL